ncbi:hypothetical protein KZZ52_33705 [Dactylosporangium sp. AC04546]|uniref:hypothetical protein n=1 Tax=Dactylosporangium sp. AC04546 TaxID=2862460 RepID=UPI001EDE8D0F|nr:hypothetical protein [Dactylosporangium sp. AC04546]WVK78931.1 hypothetical protein KZZ52_33705 [Dactylosporangium sp. AC04546]
MTQVLAVVGAIGVIASMVFAGWQSREVAKQTKIQNALAGSSSLTETLNALHNILGMMVDRPDLRPFFYDGIACPTDGPLRNSVLTIAEMLADVAETGILVHYQVRTTASIEDWNDYVDFLLRSSPTVTSVIHSHPLWYPRLKERLPSAL